jgi:GT2 family glycosyltransferase
MKVSYIIVTRNRRNVLLRTVERLEANPDLPRHAWELIVVDNASEDDTAEACVAGEHDARVIRLAEEEGVAARNHGLRVAKGKYVVFLDDDSYPMPGAMADALSYLARHAKVGALVARVVRPDGSAEAPAMPTVTFGGATIFRKSVLDQVGGFGTEFLRQAQEYDLSFRIWRVGYRVERFEDILFGHEGAGEGAPCSASRKLDLRNNLILVERYLPVALRRAYRHDWIRRYGALGLHEGHENPINAALKEARVWARREAIVGRKTLDAAAVEAVFGLDAQSKAVAEWSRVKSVRRVAIADYSKNLYATFRACRRAGLEVCAIIENNPAFVGQRYRGVRIVPDLRTPRDVDGIILSNINAAQVDARFAALTSQFSVPVLRLWHPRTLASPTNRPEAAMPARTRRRASGIDEAA